MLMPKESAAPKAKRAAAPSRASVGSSPSPARAARHTPAAITASITPATGEIRSPAATAIRAAIAPSVEAIGETTPTLPSLTARYARSRPNTLPPPATTSRPMVGPSRFAGSLKTTSGSTMANPTSITQESVEPAPISRAERDEQIVVTVHMIAAPRPPRIASMPFPTGCDSSWQAHRATLGANRWKPGESPDMSVDADVVRRLKAREDELFRHAHPQSLDLLERARASMPNGVPMAWLADSGTYDHTPVWVTEGRASRFRCVDGHGYVDFNVADMSMFCGYAPEPVVEAVSRRMAAGNQFLLPVEDSIWVAEELSRRWGLPKWQFTLSASQANSELIRVARVATGRPRVLMFEGKYHGHFDQALVTLEDGREVPEELGLPPDVTEQTRVVPFNDLDAVVRALEPRDVAAVLLEPAMTNNQGLILPDAGFHEGLRSITRETGSVLAYDETHTLVCGPGGLTRIWNLEPDAVSLGKSIAAGVPIGAYGMTEELASVFENQDASESGHAPHGVATGGTLFANALTAAAARAAAR